MECEKCGANLALVGKRHNCVPKKIAEPSAQIDLEDYLPVSDAEARRVATSKASRYKDKEARAAYKRAYMREYMRKRRAKSA